MDQKRQFVREALGGEYSMTELCERYGISRKTGYETLARWEQAGELGLVPKSHAANTCPHKTEPEIVEELLRARRKHPLWGARKLLLWLGTKNKKLIKRLPSPSTAADILKRHGLVPDRRRRRFRPPVQNGLTEATRPNHVWTADFKGEFPTLDRVYCYPLTVADDFSRYLLGCKAKPSTSGALAKPVFVELFREFGLPDIMRTDNGVPFASTGLARLSRLAVFWIKVGIRIERIALGEPSQNGRHERMHRTLKQECTRPPAPDLRVQQTLLDHFRREYNTERPHEALDMATPSALYTPSPRLFPEVIPEPEYAGHFHLRKVGGNGCIRWRTATIFLSTALVGELIGLEEIDDGIWSVRFYDIDLARYNERSGNLNYGGMMGPTRSGAQDDDEEE